MPHLALIHQFAIPIDEISLPLANKLNLELYNKEIDQLMAKKAAVPLNEITFFGEFCYNPFLAYLSRIYRPLIGKSIKSNRPSSQLWELPVAIDDSDYWLLLKETIEELIKNKNILFINHGGIALLPTEKTYFVFLYADRHFRVKKYAESSQISIKEADKQIKWRDNSQKYYLRKLGINYKNLKEWCHLAIEYNTHPPEKIYNEIIHNFRDHRFEKK